MTGKTISHYRILEKLGEGGMGVVYRARDTHLDRFVAIKVLPPERVCDPERKRRFVQEAKAASALNHPNIVHIYDISSDGGIDFIAMEYVAGKTLDQLIPRKGMRLSETLKCAVEMADALAAAHAAGIVHRDVKPANVMVSEQGRVKVLDFGLAKLTEPVAGEEAPTQTTEGAIVGTVAYMSPEQAQGLPVDARSDIFSFGAVLYEMTTGRRAFQRDTKISTLAAIINQEPAPLGAETPHDLEKLISRCLRKQPARRFQHMDDVKIALEELKEESDSGKLASSTALQPAAPKRRRWLVAAAVAAVLTVVALAWLYLRPSPQRETPLKVTPLTSSAGLESEPYFSPDGNEVVFVWNGEKGENFDIYRQLTGPGKPLRLTTDPAEDFSPAWSPDGRSLAFLRALGAGKAAVVLMPALGGPERVVGETQAARLAWIPQRWLDWSADGRWLVICDGASLALLSAETGEKRRLTAPPQGQQDRDPAFSPDGRSLAFVRAVSDVRHYLYRMELGRDLAPSGEPERLATEGQTILHPAWTADGREIVYASGYWGSLSLSRIPARGPGGARQLAFFQEGASNPALSRRANRMVFVRQTLNPDIWRVELPRAGGGIEPPAKLIFSTRYDAFPQYSPDGKRIVFESQRSGNPEIWVADSDGGNARQLTSFGTPHVGAPSWSPDGRQVAFNVFGGEAPDIYVISPDGGQPRRVTTHPARDTVPSWSRDGRWIYFTSNRTGRTEIWKVPPGGGDEVQVTRQGGFYGWECPDGEWVYYAKHWEWPTAVWKVPVAGGEEIQVFDGLSGWPNFALADEGIYYAAGTPLAGSFSICLFRFATGRSVTLATIERPLWWGLSVSPSRRHVLCTLVEQWGSDLMLVENFR